MPSQHFPTSAKQRSDLAQAARALSAQAQRKNFASSNLRELAKQLAHARARSHPVFAGISLKQGFIRGKHIERRQNLRAADGALVGYRYWNLSVHPKEKSDERDYFLISPHRKTIWYGPVLKATNWSEALHAENHAGVHASYNRARLTNEHVPPNLVSGCVHGRVRGYGKFVRGERGFRVERMMIDKLWIPSVISLTNRSILILDLLKTWGVDLPARLAARYQCRVIPYYEKNEAIITAKEAFDAL